jgi:phosphomannomutase / phosphoglucomutase
MGFSKKNGDQAAKRGSGRSIRSYWMIGVFGLLLLVATSWVAVFFAAQTEKQVQQQQQSKIAASLLAESFNALIQQQINLISSVAGQVTVNGVFSEDDPQALVAEQARLAALVPDALLVRLLPVKLSAPDTSHSPNMGFASLQLLRRAENSDQPQAELHQFGTTEQHIAIASAVRSPSGQVEGVIHAAFATQMLQKLLDSIGGGIGHIEWQQVISDKPPLVIAGKGPKAASDSQPDGVIPISNSIWQIAYWGSTESSIDPLQLAVQVAPSLLVFLFGGLLMLRLAAQMSKALKKDQHSILSLVEVLVTGRPPKKQLAHLADLQPTLDVMVHQIKEFRLLRAEKSKASQALSDDDEIGGITVEEAVPNIPEQSNLVALGNSVDISPSIFRAYDIRGVVGETLTEEVVALLGQGIGSEIYEQGHNAVVVGRDSRNSSESFQGALIQGLMDSGRDVIDLGLVPTPLVHYAAHELNSGCGVMITGSHNPPQYNGLKVIIGKDSPSRDAIQELRRRIDADQLLQAEGSFDSRDIIGDYIEQIVSDVRLGQTLKVVVDCGNGAASVVAPELYRQLGCEVVELYCTPDGDFPNHHPDPGNPKNMQDLQKAVVKHEAALGLAFDGDGDRLGVVDSSGKIIWPDRLLMYLAIDVLSREPGGDIIYDVKCSRNLANVVLSNGGRPLMWKSGHSMLKAKMKETHALLAGEFSGHIIFSERWYGFDDGIYAGARLLEILSLDYRSSAEIFAELPESLSTPEYVLRLEEGQAAKLMSSIEQLPDLPGARMVKIDGLRAEFEYGWGLVRASNTTPALLFRFEAETEEGLNQVQSIFHDMLSKIDPELKLPF